MSRLSSTQDTRPKESHNYAIYLITGPKGLRYVGITRICLRTYREVHREGPFPDMDDCLSPYLTTIEEGVQEESSLDSIKKRFKQHCRDRKKRKTLLQKAMYRYGIKKFRVSLLEEVEGKKLAIKKEKMYIISQNANLNQIDTKSIQGYFYLMEEAFEKLANSQKNLLVKTTKFIKYLPAQGQSKQLSHINEYEESMAVLKCDVNTLLEKLKKYKLA